ncbi:MAG TPA: hypothetical protein VNG33_07885 [Polyangiaceae bacterium]|nr:hypothetical protein [Polyangiaceae bacterium]
MSYEGATPRSLAAAAVLVAVLASSAAASAASPESRAAARQHVSQAEESKKKGQLADSCKHLEEAERLDPQLPTLMDLAECTEQLGKPVEAQAQWAAARDRAKHDEKPQSRARAEARLAAVQKRVAHLTLQLAANPPAGLQVLRDDVALEPASLSGALAMNPGDHLIVVRLAGHADAKYPVKLADGDNQTLPIAPGAAGAPPSAAPPVPPTASPALPPSPPSLPSKVAAEPSKPEAQPPASWWSRERKAGAILGSVGIVGIGVGSALCIVGKRGADKAGSTFDSRLALGGVSIAGGGVLFLTGAVLFAGAHSDEASQHARMTVAPTLLVARSATVLGAAGEF